MLMPHEYTIVPDTAMCVNCKMQWDLPTIRERKDYEPGICPNCGGFLKSIRERRY